ncbi:hypothetical protein AC482_06145 [miscellaneous Crenarchaeota group-15 archaeon DG-45]|uniref:Uncharacterized protein n=1 Tax=miscellaneous Crenarchaeota group-15 archaeon DG-45 TaxID=1685127 RepID=A0A0M0BLV7_9ARCH|nr:MAG: hypothetical protein AC482_06145 [miscellaneous Crenarchaeota group-15 archaeon DG-45]
MIRSRRGAVHTLEAFLAAVIIFTTLLCSASMPRERDRAAETPLEAVGMEALLRLDGNGTLGRLVEAGGWDPLELSLRAALPVDVSFNLTVLDEDGIPVNDQLISNGGLVGRTVASVEYLLAVESSSCPLYRLRLQLGV